MRRSTILLMISATVAPVGLTSCNYLAPLAYLTMGDPKTDAQYELSDKPTVVFVDDRRNAIPLNSQNTRRAIADAISQELLNRELVAHVIAPADVMALARRADRDTALMSLAELGEAVGAEQFIYVEMDEFKGSPDGIQPRLVSSCRVKVVDLVAHERTFPPTGSESGYREVRSLSGIMDLGKYDSDMGKRELQMHLAELTAENVAKLFYKHRTGDIGSRIQQ